VLQEGGFRFDMGPTILTIPEVLRRIFAEAGRPLDEYLDLVRLDPQWRSFFEDGSQLDLTEDLAAMVGELQRFAPRSGAAEGYTRFLDHSAKLHEISERYFFWKPIGGMRDMFDWKGFFQPARWRCACRCGSVSP
jgi:phytoene dehydrogenase-like protein